MVKSTRTGSSRKAAIDKPPKPYPDFPLGAANCGSWQKKINGRIHYFGKWGRVVDGKLVRIEGDGWKEALELYKAQADDLHSGRTPRVKTEGLTVAELCNRFLTAKHHKRTSGELGARMFQDYKDTTDIVVAAFGKDRSVDDLAADDFEQIRASMAERWGPVRLGNTITRVKSVFKYGLDNGLIEKAIRYGSEFKKPNKAVLRRHRAQTGERMLEADQLRKLIETANVPLNAMILLGLNAGFGNHDVATLPLSALDLDRGWLNFPRPKTGIARRCPLWPETVAAIRQALAVRPVPKDEADADIVFLLTLGRRWVRTTERSRNDNICIHFTNVMKTCGTHRDGIGFYTLRHVFRTVADAARDPVAIDLIMGHSDPSMGGHYRERIEDSRLQAVAEHVRAWLFGETQDDDTTGEQPDEATSETNDPPQREEGGDDRPTLKLFAG